MSLSPEQEWALVGCGLIAHADGILDVGEWDQVVFLVGERLDGLETKRWVDLLSDHARLREHFSALAPPAPMLSEAILEKAWRMALADGVGSDAEAKVHDEIAARLGIDLTTMGKLRADWNEKAYERSEIVVGFASYLAHLDECMDVAEVESFERLLETLALRPGRREALAALLDNPPSLDAVVGQLMRLSSEDRAIALVALVPIVHRGVDGQAERHAFVELAQRVAIPREDAERMLER